MTKREIVLDSFGEYREYVEQYVDENGWLNRQEHSAFIRNHFYLEENLETKFVDKVEFWRPKSLEGIEDNNGWVKLEGLPQEIKNRCSIWIETKNGDIEYFKENEFLPVGYAVAYKVVEKPLKRIY